jgi:DNA polymerase III delta prime subunit
MSELKQLWVEKYRPATIDEYIFQDKQQQIAILNFVADETIPHLLLSGVQGTGKTSLAFMLLNELDVDPSDVLKINASDENSVDVMRDKIKNFVSTWASGDYKIVVLDEADYISHNGQAVLRRMMEEFSDAARFIITCNYEHKILPAVKSRCQHFHFKSFPKDKIIDRVTEILLNESVIFEPHLVEKYVVAGYPDIRKIIHLLQQNTVAGELKASNVESSSDWKFGLLDLLESDSWQQIRTLLCSTVVDDEWEDVYRFLYENIHKVPRFNEQSQWDEAIVIIADHLYKHSVVSMPDINAAAMFIKLEK